MVVLKIFFTSADATRLKNLVHKWGEGNPLLSFEDNANSPNMNFHRLDLAPAKSCIPHIFHQYGFGDQKNLPEPLRDMLSYFVHKLLRIQNELAATSFSLGDEGFRAKVIHYLAGGGFLASHRHPFMPQKVGLICSLSEPGVDYKDGGTIFDTPAGKINTIKFQNIGDVLLFRYDLAHEVLPTDTEEEIDWRSKKGRWSLVLELLATHSKSSPLK